MLSVPFNIQLYEMNNVGNEGDREKGLDGYAQATQEAGYALQRVYEHLTQEINKNAIGVNYLHTLNVLSGHFINFLTIPAQ